MGKPRLTYSSNNLLLLCVIYILISDVTSQAQRQVTIPPLITRNPPLEMAFREGESLEMLCVGDGEPEPTYRWEMNDLPFDPSGNAGRIAIQPGVGTLIFANPIERDEGIYQCFAENSVGTALTVRVNLREAFLEPFTDMTVRPHRPQVGHALTLRCVPPRSFPHPIILWATLGDGQAFIPIQLTDRVTIDPTGDLHFTNIVQEDWHNGRTYGCVVQNIAMRAIQHGEYATITPQGQNTQFLAPALLWASPTHQVGLRGNDLRMKCIFSGNPTPRVDWARLDGILPLRARIESFGQDLVIRDIQYEDTGRYECQGINDEAVVPIRRSFDVSVQSAPHWTNKPVSVSGAEEDRAVFNCEADGIPEPVFLWFINGIPISQLPADPRRVATRNQIVFYNITKDDAQVLQCNATNNHGYLWENAFLNVLTEPPIITEPPEVGQRGAEGSTILLRCQVFGSPVPLVVWRRGTEQLTGGRFRVLPSGDLEIEDLMMTDGGVFTCTATNKYDTVSASGSLLVRRRTQIERAPQNTFIIQGKDAKLTCTGSTDVAEMGNFRVDWMRDGTWIDYDLAQRIVQNHMDNSLAITGTITLDTGEYTCAVRNGLDEDRASASLIVMGPPDPPHNVWVLCTNDQRRAEISWTPGLENDAPILNFIIEFNTTFAPAIWNTIAQNVSQNERRLVVTLSPWGNYTFRVVARNKIGMSRPSVHTSETCRIQPDRPFRNPDNVMGEGDMPNNLVIFWTPMPWLEQNGPDFRYFLSWKRLDDPGAQESTALISRGDAWHYVVPQTQETYKPFEIRVQSGNTRGDSIIEPEMVIGYSGEDTPLVTPQDVSVDDDTIESTEAVLEWTQVDTDPDEIRGFFRGYRVEFAPLDHFPEDMRAQDFFFRDAGAFPRPRFKRDLEDDVKVKLMTLPPNTELMIQVRVLNKYYAGPPSSAVVFKTKEGLPGPPAMFTTRIVGSTHLELLWEEPLQINGELLGYNISYQTITGLNLGRLQYRLAEIEPEVTRARLTGLLPITRYRVFLKGVTKAGPGDAIFLEMLTAPVGPPNPPTFWFTGVTDSWVNVSWQASQQNPGSVFYVGYRPRGATEWWNTPDEGLFMHMELHGLDPGTTYQVRVVSKNGDGYQSPSEWQEVRTSGIAPGHFDLGRAAWFYGIFVSLILAIVLTVLFIMMKKYYTDVAWVQKELEIEEQVRQLQAEEAARQVGEFNEYAAKGYDADGSYEEEEYYPDKDPKDAVFEDKGKGYKDGYDEKEGFRDDPHGFVPTNTGYDPARTGYNQSFENQQYDDINRSYDQDYDESYDQGGYDTRQHQGYDQRGGSSSNVYHDSPRQSQQPGVRMAGPRNSDTFA